MAFLGFVLCIIGGIGVIISAIGFVIVGKLLGGKIEWSLVIVLSGSGLAGLYFALTNAPFVITFVG